MDYVPAAELDARILRLQKVLTEKGFDGALVCGNVNLFYFTGTLRGWYLLVPAVGDPVLMTRGRVEDVRKESCIRNIEPLTSSKELPDRLKSLGLSATARLGLELDILPVRQYLQLKDLLPRQELADVSWELRLLRARKSSYEIDQIRRAASISDALMAHVPKVVREGVTEVEADAELFAVGRRLGHQGLVRMRGWNLEMLNLYVLSGESAANSTSFDAPVTGPGLSPAIGRGSTDKVLRAGEPIIIDCGMGWNGYLSDETRVFSIGPTAEKYRRAFRVMADIEREMESSTKPGMESGEVYRKAVLLAKRYGYEEFFMNYGDYQVSFVGHGIGLELNEPPFISRNGSTVLEPGMVFAFEPKVVFPGECAIGIEDDYLVTERGVERLTSTAQSLFEIGT